MLESYIYLIANLPLLVIAIFCLFKFKHYRFSMFKFGVVGGACSYIGQRFLWGYDWWSPVTLSGNHYGVEDFLLGFSTVVILSHVYALFSDKKEIVRKRPHHFLAATIFVLAGSFCIILFKVFNVDSVSAVIVSMFIFGLVTIFVRKDLALVSIFSGILSVVISLPFYFTILALDPSWAVSHYYKEVYEGMRFLTFPIEEFVFFFFYGFYIGPFYDFYSGRIPVNKK